MWTSGGVTRRVFLKPCLKFLTPCLSRVEWILVGAKGANLLGVLTWVWMVAVGVVEQPVWARSMAARQVGMGRQGEAFRPRVQQGRKKGVRLMVGRWGVRPGLRGRVFGGVG